MVRCVARPVRWRISGNVSITMSHPILPTDHLFCRTMLLAVTRGVSRAVGVHYASQDLAEAAFHLALQAGHVEVL